MYLLVKHRDEIFTTRFHRIMFCIPPESLHQKLQFFNKLKGEFNEIELVLGLPKEENVLDNALPKLILIDDLMTDVYKNPFVEQMFIQHSHHNSASIAFTAQVTHYKFLKIQSL